MTTELPSAAPPPGQPRQASRYLLLSAAVVVFAASLVLSFSRVAQQHEAALRDAGANLRAAFLADHEMQQLRHGFDVFALGGEGADRETLRAGHERLLSALYRLTEEPALGATAGAADPMQHMIAELRGLQPELETFRPGDRARHADLAARLDGIGAPLHRMVADVDAIALDEAERSAQRRWLYLEEVLYLLGMLGSGGVFVAMLLRESRRTWRLLAEATDAQVRIEHLAHHDQLTDLPNRWLFKDRLDQALRLAHRAQAIVAIHCVDVDRFKLVNDRYGHVTGDKVLVAVAERMQACVRQSDTVARLGGDEFAIVQVGVADGGAMQLAERLLAAFREPLLADGHKLMVTVSIGIALYPAHATTADALHRAADTALYRAKETGRDRCHEWQPDDDRSGPPVRYRAVAG